MNIIQQILKMQWSDYLDILVVAYLIYKLLPLLRTPHIMRLARTVIALVLIAWITSAAKLYTINWLLNQLLAVGLLAFVVLFQPELRRMLDHLGNVKISKFFGMPRQVQEMDAVITQTVRACEAMSRKKVGALIVFARDQRLEEYFKTGTSIDAQVSDQLIRNIFFKNSPLHDGAMIIRDGRIAAAGCVLPLSNNENLAPELGTRHRAGVGMSEATDAVVVIVSEENGSISVATGGMLKRFLKVETLDKLLRQELHTVDSQEESVNFPAQVLKKLTGKAKEDGGFRDAISSLSLKSASDDIGLESTSGGGVTQVSSTLYCAALLSDLTVSSRSNLSYLPSFVKEGFDADIDLTIKNTLSYPVRISAQYSGGYVRVSILGTEQRDYYRTLGSDITKTIPPETEFRNYPYDNPEGIRHDDTIQEGRDGYQVKSYSVRYDSATNQKLTSDYIATSNYAPVSYIYAVVEEPETEPPTEEQTEPSTEDQTEPSADSWEEESSEPKGNSPADEEALWDAGDAEQAA